MKNKNFKQKAKKFFFSKWKISDYLIYFVLVPLVLFGIYLLPEIIKQSLRLNIYSPTFITIFMSNYLHLTFNHLLSNIWSYLIVMFLIFNLETNKKFFYRISLFGFLILPFLVFIFEKILFNLFNINNFPLGQGFSAITTFFIGYLVFVSYTYIRKKYSSDLSKYFLFFLIMLNIFIWSLFNSWKLSLGASILLILIIIWRFNQIVNPVLKIFEDILEFKGKKLKRFKVYKFLIFVLTLTFIISLILIIPREIVNGSAIINTAAHFIGYLLGVFTPLLFFSLYKKKINFREFFLMLIVVFLAGFGGNLLIKSSWYLGALFSFKSLKDEVDDIKKQLGMDHGLIGFHTIKDKIDKLENEIKEIKRGLKIR